MVGLLGHLPLEQGMDMAALCQQHHPEGIPVQPGQGVKRRCLIGCAVIALNIVGQSSGVSGLGRVDQHARGLIHRQKIGILK